MGIGREDMTITIRAKESSTSPSHGLSILQEVETPAQQRIHLQARAALETTEALNSDLQLLLDHKNPVLSSTHLDFLCKLLDTAMPAGNPLTALTPDNVTLAQITTFFKTYKYLASNFVNSLFAQALDHLGSKIAHGMKEELALALIVADQERLCDATNKSLEHVNKDNIGESESIKVLLSCRISRVKNLERAQEALSLTVGFAKEKKAEMQAMWKEYIALAEKLKVYE